MMGENLKLELKYYNQAKIWDNYINNQLEINRARETLEFIPSFVESVLDIGCGNGTITNLINRRLVVGLDFAKIPLSNVKRDVIQASVDALPIKSKKFDLVLLTEVLEHLQDNLYSRAIKDIKRLEPEYLLITVPFNENLSIGLCKCRLCGHLFNPNNHYRSFDEKWFKIMFSEYRLEKIGYSSYRCPANEMLFSIRQKMGVYSQSSTAVCNKCGGSPLPPNQLLRYMLGGLTLVDHYLRIAAKIKRPYHQIVLLKNSF